MKISESAGDASTGSLASRTTAPMEHKLRLSQAIAWTVLIMVLCWLPRPVVARVERDGSFFLVPNFDKLVHCGIFVVFGVLWVRAIPYLKKSWMVAVAFGFIVLTELVQEIPAIGRDATVGDAVADTLGVLIGVMLTPLLEPWLLRFDRWLIESVWRRAATSPAETNSMRAD